MVHVSQYDIHEFYGNVNQYNHYNQQNQGRCLLGCFFDEVGVRLCPSKATPQKIARPKVTALLRK